MRGRVKILNLSPNEFEAQTSTQLKPNIINKTVVTEEIRISFHTNSEQGKQK